MFESVAMDSYQWNSARIKLSRGGRTNDIDAMTVLASWVEATNKKLDGSTLMNQALVMSCETCERGHSLQDCQNSLCFPSKQMQQVAYLGNAIRPQNNLLGNIRKEA